MPQTALWEVSTALPARLARSRVALEAHLESWIEADPSMLPGDLEVVARQMTIDAGRLDLLALDPQGRLCIIEIKRGALQRETVAQAIDYAACLDLMETEELRARLDAYLENRGKSLAQLLDARQSPSALDLGERELVIFVVGVGREPGLERVSGFLARHRVAMSLISFEAFSTGDGRLILSREVTEEEPTARPATPGSSPTPQELLARATSNGIGVPFGTLLKAGLDAGLHPRTFPMCVMFAPPAMKSRALFTIWSHPRDGRVQAWVGNKVFAEFFPMTVEAVHAALGPEGWQYFDQPGAASFASGLRTLIPSASTVREA